MSKPKIEIKTKDYFAGFDDLLKIIQKESVDKERLKRLLQDLLTESEIRMLKRRWHVANLINEGKSVRETAGIAGVGTDTVIRVINKIKKGTGALKEILTAKILNSNSIIQNKKNNRKKQQVKLTKWFFGVK